MSTGQSQLEGVEMADGAANSSAQFSAVRSLLTSIARLQLSQFLALSETEQPDLAALSGVAAYYDTPRVTIFSTQFDQASDAVDFAIDLRANSMRVIAFPGQSLNSVLAFNVARGLFDNILEQSSLPAISGAQSIGTINVLEQAGVEGIPFALLSGEDPSALDGFDLSANAKALINASLSLGDLVLVPTQEVAIGSSQTVSWLTIRPSTGQTTGVLESGINSNQELGPVETTATGTVATAEAAVQPLLPRLVVSIANAALRITRINTFAQPYKKGIKLFLDFLSGVELSAIGLLSVHRADAWIAFLGITQIVKTLFDAGDKLGDPPLPALSVGTNLPNTVGPANIAQTPQAVGVLATGGAATGTIVDETTSVSNATISGALWNSKSSGSFWVNEVDPVLCTRERAVSVKG